MRGPLACMVAISTGSDKMVDESVTNPTAVNGHRTAVYYGSANVSVPLWEVIRKNTDGNAEMAHL